MRIKTIGCIILIAFSVLNIEGLPVAQAAPYTFTNFADFLTQFNAAPSENKQQVVDDYLTWQTANGGFPAIQNDTHVVFIFCSVQITYSVKVTGDFNSWDSSGISMTKLGSISKYFFYKQMQFPPTARLDYKFIVDVGSVEWRVDPRNPHTVTGGFGPNSELAMPLFVQPTEIIKRNDIPKGTVTTLTAPWNDPKVSVYLPPDYNASLSYPSFYTSDGSEYLSYASTATILDNLIADKRIEPVIGIFVNPYIVPPDENDRVVWYNCNVIYLNYLDGLVEYIDSNYATNKSPFARLHLGDSMGGLVSAYVGLERNETFKLVGSHSGAFWVAEDSYHIKTKYEAASASLQLKMWFSAGTYEPSIYYDTLDMANYSVDKGWPTEAIYLYEGHSWGSWRHTFDDMMDFFFPYINETSTEPEPTDSDRQKIAGYPILIVFSIIGITVIVLANRLRKNRT